jgi:hypothetical protein
MAVAHDGENGGGTSLDDAERGFWKALEYRVSREFEGLDDRTLRFMGCDGLIPEQYNLQAREPSIQGLAYCGQSGQERWQFTLLIGASAEGREHINWAALLPAEDVTGWLSPHPHAKTLVIDPLAAYPDA